MFWFFYYTVFLYFLFLVKNYNRFHGVLFFVMIFFLGQRWMTGEDFPGYLLYYLIDFKGVDFGFFLLQDFFKFNNFSFSLFVLFLYILTLGLTYKFIGKFEYSALIFVLFSITELSFIQLSQLKQSLAIPLFLFSFYYFYHKKIFLGLLFIILSSSVHVASLFLIPFLFIRVPLKNKQLKFILFAICLMPLINITSFIPPSLFFKFGHYLNSDYNQSLSFFHYIKFYGVVTLFYFLYNSNKQELLINNKIMLSGFIIYLALYSLSFQFAPFMRLSYFFRIFEVITLVNLAKNSNYRYIFGYVVIPFYSVAFLAIGLLDPYNVSRYSFEPVSIYEQKTESQLHLEIDQFYEE